MNRESADLQIGESQVRMEVSYKGVDADCGDGGGERDLGEMAASRWLGLG